MKIKYLVLAIAFCMIAAPVKADLFSFTYDALNTVWDNTGGTSSFTAVETSKTLGSVIDWQVPTSQAGFIWGFGGIGGDFSISMTLSNITATSADATGSFTLTDTQGDTITGQISGTWGRDGLNQANDFSGILTNVVFNDIGTADGLFDGHLGAADMSFNQLPPWAGSIVQLTAAAPWFGNNSYFNVSGGSVDARVIPVPAAVVLGILGLGVAGLKLRKFA